jgi:hypothetical protein
MAAIMQTVKKLKYLIVSYLAVLVFLLLCVTATPLIIRHGLAVTRQFIIEEEFLESALIFVLFAISFLIFIGFRHTLKAYERAVARIGADKSKLLSRLTEAFSYIGTVNVEIKEIESILCGVAHYPQTKREFKQLLDHLATKIMAVAGTAWVAIRIISRSSGRTVKEHAVESREGVMPSSTMGNREILEGRQVQGFRAIRAGRKNLDLLTVCILPMVLLSEEDIVLITAIANQIEMLFMLHRAGCLHQKSKNPKYNTEKEVCHDTHY